MHHKSFCQLKDLEVTFKFMNSEGTMVLFNEVSLVFRILEVLFWNIKITLKFRIIEAILKFRSFINQEHKVNHLLGTLNVSAARS